MKLVVSIAFLGLCISEICSQEMLTLDKAIEIGLDNNYGIMLARNQLNVSEMNNHPGSAGMLPKIDVTGSRNYQVNNTYQEYFDGRVRESDDARSNSLNAGVQMNWSFFDGFGMFVRKNKLDELQRLDETQLRIRIENTLADIIIAYYNIVIQSVMVDVYHEAMLISTERKKFAAARLELGSGSELSWLQASVDLNADSSAWIAQVMALENSKSDLNKLLCRDLSEDFDVMNDIPLRQDLVFEYLIEQALEVNPGIQTARINLAVAALNIRETMSVMYPRLNFSTGYSFGRSISEVGLLQRNRNFGYYAGVSLSYNIFNGFNNQRDIKTAKIRQESAHLSASQTELNIRAELTKVYNDYITNLRLINLENENLSLASKNFRIAEEKYRLGSITDIELRETQNKMMDAELRYYFSLYRSKSAETELLLLSGGIQESMN